jgi:hypothetical protein
MPRLKSDAEYASQLRIKLRAGLPVALGIVGWLLIASSLNTILFAILPLRLTQPGWQLALVGIILTTSMNLLIGAGFICLVPMIGTQARIAEYWFGLIGRSSSWFALLLLLLIPLQFHAGFRALANQNDADKTAVKNLERFQFRIRQSNSEAELRSYVASLPTAPMLPAVFDSPFPVIRQRAVDNLQNQINAATTLRKQQEANRLQQFLKEVTRNSVQAILMALAFASIGHVDPRHRNPVTRVLRRLLPGR